MNILLFNLREEIYVIDCISNMLLWAWCYAQKCLSRYDSNNGNDDIARHSSKIIDRVRLSGNDDYIIVAHRSYDDESLMVLSFNLESLVHADEQSSYQLGIAAFRPVYYFFLSGDEVKRFRIDIHLA